MINDRTKTTTDYIDTLQAEQGDLRVALFVALGLLRVTSKLPFWVYQDVIEANAKDQTYEDLKIDLAQRKKECDKDDPLGHMFRTMFDGEPPEDP